MKRAIPNVPKVEGTRRAQMIRALQVSTLLFAGFLIVTEQVLTHGYLDRVDHQIKAIKHHTFRGMSSHLLLALDDLGLRWFTATVLIVISLLIGWRYKTWRPLNLSILSLLALNGVVGVAKLLIGRTKPRLSIDQLHFGGMSYPSGHASNAIISWGLVAYLIYRYSHSGPFRGISMAWLPISTTTAVFIVSLLRNTHWFSDLLGGVFLGGSILVAIIAIDRWIPSERQPS
jgi:PAP2 superfamily